MKKYLSIILVLFGATLLITAVVFWVDTTTSTQPPSFGESLRDWMTAIVGLGASIKGWLDLLRKEKMVSPTVQINISGEKDLKLKLHAYPEDLYKTKNDLDTGFSHEMKIDLTTERNATKSISEISSVYDYVEALNAQVSQINSPGIPEFPSGIMPTLQEIYVDQKFVVQKTDRIIPLSSFTSSSNSVWLKDSAGVGKSTFLKYVTSLACRNYLDGTSKKVPLKLHAGDVIGGMHSFSVEVTRRIREKYNLNSKLLSNIDNQIQNGESVLLVDAIDEIPFEAQKRLIESLTDSDFFLKHNQILLTSRPLPYLDINIVEAQITRFKHGDAFKLISNWQNVLQNNDALTTKADDYLEKFKGSFIGDIYNSGDVRADIVETPLFLVFLILYLSSPATSEEKDPFSILTSKTRLLSRIVEHVIPYWESQKRNRDLISPIKNIEALQVLHLIGFLTKVIPALTPSDLLWGIEQNRNILSVEINAAREYLLLWKQANVLNFDEGYVKFWHEEIRDFCVARHLASLYKREFINEADLGFYLIKPEWKSVAFYLNNILRLGDLL